MPAERWPEIEEAVQRLAPIASEAVMAIFQRRLGSQLEEAFDEIARRLSERRT
jgi:ribose 1,5-bisphosphokinase PhnN